MTKIGITDRFALLMVIIFYITTVAIGFFYHPKAIERAEGLIKNSKMLNHIVLVKFKPTLTSVDLQLITDGGYSL